MTQASNGQLRIGLTGGIASGKTAVADLFAARGIAVIDTDLVSREVVEPGQPGLQAVAAAFGNEILLADGSLDRAQLRKLIFENSDARERLEGILHPLIRHATFAHASKTDGPYRIFAVPLLAETGFDELVDRVLVIDCPEELQRQRLMERDNESESSADIIISTQASRQQRLDLADDVIVNDGTLRELEESVEKLHQKYLRLSSADTGPA